MKKEQSEADKARVREQARLRKQKQRAKKATLAVKALEINASASEKQQLNQQATIRGFDSISEYLMTLMRIDGERIKHDQAAIGTCNSCKLPLPQGCKTVFKGQFDCSYIHGLPLVKIKEKKMKEVILLIAGTSYEGIEVLAAFKDEKSADEAISIIDEWHKNRPGLPKENAPDHEWDSYELYNKTFPFSYAYSADRYFKMALKLR